MVISSSERKVEDLRFWTVDATDLASAIWNTRVFSRRDLVLDVTSGSLRKGPGIWANMRVVSVPGVGGGGDYDPPIPQTDVTGLVAELASKAGAPRDYLAGMVVEPYDLIQYLNVLYYSVSETFTASNWANDQGNFTAIGVSPAYLLGVLNEGDGDGVGLIESSDVVPIILKKAEAGAGLNVIANTGSFEFEIDANDASNVLDGATDPFARTSVVTALGTVAELRTGSALAFDVPAVYNSQAVPTSGSVTLDETGAVGGTVAIAYWNHGSEPSWPAGITVGGNAWDDGGVNEVVFVYHSAGVISGTITSNAAGTASSDVKAALTASVSTSLNTAQTMSGMSVTILAGQKYIGLIKISGQGVTSGSHGINFGLYFSAGTGQTIRGEGIAPIGGVFAYWNLLTTQGMNAQNTSHDIFDTGAVSQSAFLHIEVLGGSVDSVMDLRYCSETNGQTVNVFAPGTFMYFHKV